MNNKDRQIMEIRADEQFIKNYQALYYAMNAKPDCKSKLFDKDVVITTPDLKNLNNRITEKFKAHYDNAGFRINVNINFKDRESIEFDSWATFEKYDLNIEKPVNSILIVWEYNAKLPGYPLPQKHTLTVRLADELRPEEMLNIVISGKLEEVDKIDQEICPIVARVDFINSMLCDELLYIVESWQKGLLAPDLEQYEVYKILKKYNRIIAYAINYISLFVVVWCVIKVIGNDIIKLDIETLGAMSIDTFGRLLHSIVYGIVFCIAAYKIFQVIANIVFTTLRSNSDNHTFDITNGDKVIRQKIEQGIKRKKSKIVGNIIFTFMFNIVCSVLANYIS